MLLIIWEEKNFSVRKLEFRILKKSRFDQKRDGAIFALFLSTLGEFDINKAFETPKSIIYGSIVNTPTQDCTHFLKIGFVVAGGVGGSIPSISTKGRKLIKKENCKK